MSNTNFDGINSEVFEICDVLQSVRPTLTDLFRQITMSINCN